jgi:hypothetical protein
METAEGRQNLATQLRLLCIGQSRYQAIDDLPSMHHGKRSQNRLGSEWLSIDRLKAGSVCTSRGQTSDCGVHHDRIAMSEGLDPFCVRCCRLQFVEQIAIVVPSCYARFKQSMICVIASSHQFSLRLHASTVTRGLHQFQ